MVHRSSLSSSRRRCRLAAATLALLLGATACGGDGDTEGAAGTTAPASDEGRAATASTARTGETDPEEEGSQAGTSEGAGNASAVCADMVTTVLEPVHVPDDEEDVYAYEEEAFQTAISRLAEEGPTEITEDAAAVETAMSSTEEDPSDDEVISLLEAFERLIVWGAENCEVDGPLWACFVRSSFVEVGQAIPGPGETVPPSAGAATPEAAVGDGDGEGERVEAFRSDDEVVFAWLDERGLALRSEAAERGPDGWDADRSTECRDEDAVRFEPTPGPVDEDDTAPPTTRVP